MAPLRLLIVDNQRGIRRSLRAILEPSGMNFEMHEAASGEEALLAIARMPHPLDLLITDVRLAGISGLDLAHRLRQRSPGLKVILTASGIDEHIRQEALQAHVNALLARPVDSAELIQAVQRCLGQEAAGAGPVGLQGTGDLGKRLDALRLEMGALAILALDMSGRLLSQAGEVSPAGAFDPAGPVIPALLEALKANTRLAQTLGGRVPDDLLCLAGPKVDLFAAHVGEACAMLVLFDRGAVGITRARAARLVTAAVEDLAPWLPHVEGEAVEGQEAHRTAGEGAGQKADVTTGADSMQDESVVTGAGARQDEDVMTGVGARQDEGVMTEESSLASPLPTSPLQNSLEDLEAIFQQASLLQFDRQDIDQFWEEAVEQQEGGESANPDDILYDPDRGSVEE